MEGRKGKDENDSEREKERMLEKILQRKWEEEPVGGGKVGKRCMKNQRS